MILKKKVIIISLIIVFCSYYIQREILDSQQKPIKKEKNIIKPDKYGNPPNIVLITVDGLRYDASTQLLTSINEIGNIVFTQAISSASHTTPAIASLLTGNYPYNTGVHLYTDSIPDNMPLLQEKLKDQRYQTYGIFTAGIVNRILINRSWDYWYIHNKVPYMQADEATKMALDVLKNNNASPFFLWVHYLDPHTPFMPPEKYVNEHDIRRKLYYNGEVRFVNYGIGELINQLDLQNTIIILSADHGWGLWDHDYDAHCHKLFEEQLRIPLVFYIPGMSEKRVIDRQVRIVDIAPTILELVGINLSDVDGKVYSMKKSYPHIVKHIIQNMKTKAV